MLKFEISLRLRLRIRQLSVQRYKIYFIYASAREKN